MAKLIHNMIRVLDESRSKDFYCRAFGMKVASRLDFSEFTLVYLQNEETDFELELTINKNRSESYDLGDGYGHLAFMVKDLEAEHTRLRDEGLLPRKIVEFAPDGELIGKFFFIQDPDGYEIEVIQQGGRFV